MAKKRATNAELAAEFIAKQEGDGREVFLLKRHSKTENTHNEYFFIRTVGDVEARNVTFNQVTDRVSRWLKSVEIPKSPEQIVNIVMAIKSLADVRNETEQ